MQVFFEDLALPHLIRTQLAETPEWKSHRAGFTSDGTPTNLHVVRSMRGAIGRRIAIGAQSRRELRELEQELETLLREAPIGDAASGLKITALEARISELRARVARIPFLDPIDLRFRNRIKVPVPTSKAVMFYLMDVSGSMDEGRKDLAKRFFILLYLFLTRHYDKIDIVFIRHHTQAAEVDEQNFFHATETVTLTDKPMSEADAAAVDKVFTSGYTAEAQKAFPGLWVGIWEPEKGHHDPAAPRHDERDSRLPQRVRTAGSSRSSPPTPRPSSRPTI